MSNIYTPTFDEDRAQPGFRCRRARIGVQLGAQRLGASVWEVAPDQAVCPYHFHYGDEELLFVIEGQPHLRTPAGWRRLGPGDAVSFRRGEPGAHQVVNRTAEPVLMLVVSANSGPDVCVYPDSAKVGCSMAADAVGVPELYFQATAAVDYYVGEQPPFS